MLSGITNFIFGTSTAETEADAVEFTTTPADEEWVLVDKNSPRRPRHGKENTPAHFVHVKTCALEESWLVTPPPCFTVGSNQDMESSPMENLLIEHPSMSVYGPRQQRTGSADTEQSSSSAEETRLASPPSHRAQAITAKAALKLKYQTTQSMQNHLRRVNTRSFTRSKMERQNKVHFARSHKHNRRDHLVQPQSRCVSNKKC